jgi:hypothetical protein
MFTIFGHRPPMLKYRVIPCTTLHLQDHIRLFGVVQLDFQDLLEAVATSMLKSGVIPCTTLHLQDHIRLFGVVQLDF